MPQALGCISNHPLEVEEDLLLSLSLLPLMVIDFRLSVAPDLTCSDAAAEGNGACVSAGLTEAGERMATRSLYGMQPEPDSTSSLLAVGLFDGIGALHRSLDVAGMPVSSSTNP